MLRKIYFGDNLGILRGLETGCVQLVCADPPFNSGRDYTDSQSQRTAFVDTWTWDDAAQDARREIDSRAQMSSSYAALNNALIGYDFVLQQATRGAPSAMRAYLAFMGPRIVECHRVLHPAGSMYLHCDATASHYLKGLMDAVFGVANFRNQIIWGYGSPGRPKRHFPRKHDILLFYAKGEDNTFNPEDILIPHARIDKRTVQEGWHRGNPKVFDDAVAAELVKGKVPFDWWTDVAPAYKSTKEWLGYPTQKPRTLYERIIRVSSNPGDIVLDPFCGCGTTIDAAETLNRQWIGIDVTLLALELAQKRLRERHGLEPREFHISMRSVGEISGLDFR